MGSGYKGYFANEEYSLIKYLPLSHSYLGCGLVRYDTIFPLYEYLPNGKWSVGLLRLIERVTGVRIPPSQLGGEVESRDTSGFKHLDQLTSLLEYLSTIIFIMQVYNKPVTVQNRGTQRMGVLTYPVPIGTDFVGSNPTPFVFICAGWSSLNKALGS